MANNVKVLVLRTAGTNCNEETAFAFSYFGASVDQVHVNELASGAKKLATITSWLCLAALAMGMILPLVVF